MKKFVLFFILLFFFSLLVPRLVLANNVFFADDFEDGTYNEWSVRSGTWSVKNILGSKRLGSIVSNKQTVVEITAGSLLWEDYIYEADMIALRGADKNIIFRVKDNNNRYGIHMRSRDGNVSSLVCIERWSNKGGDVPSSWDECREWGFINNQNYHLKIIVLDNNIKFYIDDKLVINYIDGIAPIYNGKIGLKVSTGAVAPSEVYFDNISVTKIKSPVVLVPGHGASINFKEMFLYPNQDEPEGWQMVPGVHVYDNLINTLEDNGYEKDRDLFTFYYNWLNPIASSSAKLHDFVLPIVATSSTGKVDIVGHSMGGLVGRACVQNNNEDHCFVDHLITVGTPHKGVVEAYGAWEGGEVWRSGLSKLAFELFLNAKRQLGETKKEAIRRLAPSTKEMLPIFPYLKDINGSFLSQQPPNLHLGNDSLFKFLQVVGDNGKFIYGKDRSTLYWLTVTENLSWVDKVLGNWQQYGKPIGKEHSSDGDGTVLELSANPQEAGITNSIGFPLGHSEIVSQGEAVSKILNYLDLEAISSGDFQDNDQNYLVFYLHSPAHLEIANLPQQGTFLGDDSGKLKLVIIADPKVDDEYAVNVVGDSKGEYTLTVGQISDEQSSWDDYRGLTNLGEKDMFLIKFGPDINQEGLKDIQVMEGELPLNELIDSLK